ncbi:MAG TPA: hypothetical protein VIG51_10870, partial [Candidatus Baltobacteraceae bacterium]
LRLGPPWSIHLWGHTIPSPFFPGVLMPAVLFVFLFAYPFIERAVTGDSAVHHLLEKPRDNPARTGVGVAVFLFALGLTLAGSGDVQARYLHESITAITTFYRGFCILAPILGFLLGFAIASELRRRHGVHEATRVRLRRNEQGGFDEEPIA